MPAKTPTSSATHRTYSFGEFALDLDRGALLRAGADVKLRPKSFEVLSYLVERQGLLVTRDELLNEIWGHTVVTEDAVTQCLRDIRKAIRDQSQEMIRTVPRRGYIFDLPVTKRGGSATASEAPSGTKFASSWPRWRLVVSVVLMLGVVAVWWGFGDRAVKLPAKSGPHSVAVLPFLDMSPGQDQAYFADGISEEILNLLARVPGLRVIARTSSFSFKGQNVDIATIAEQLNVTHVLEGSVRTSSDRIRITAQLVNAATSEHLWSEVYDRELENIFAAQDEISAAVVGALEEHFGLHVEATPQAFATTNTEAHEAYLRGRYLLVQRTRAAVEGAVRKFEKAIALDPDYAPAHAELAIAILFQTVYGDLTVTEAIARAAPHAEQAMSLGPTLAEAHAASGYVLRFQGNTEEALTRFRQAIQINPNYATAYNAMGVLFDSFLGRYNESFAAYETALRLDPLSIPAIGNYVFALLERNRLDEADQELEKLASFAPASYASFRGYRTSLGGKWSNAVLGNLDALRISPESVRSRRFLTRRFAFLGLGKEALSISEDPLPSVLSLLGRPGNAVTAAEARLANDPDSPGGHHDLGLAQAGAGDYARAQPILEEMWQRSGGRVGGGEMFRIESAAALIAVRRNAGEESEIGELVAAMRDNVRRYREAGVKKVNLMQGRSADYEEGLSAYLSGERERGLIQIAKAVEDGFFIPQSEAYLQALYDDPGFAPIRESQEFRQTREREKFLAIVCNDNPYKAVWQPAEGTCEKYAEDGGN